MAAQIFDCKKIAEGCFSRVREEMHGLKGIPSLAVLSKEEDSPSSVYRNMVMKDAGALGIPVSDIRASDEEALELQIKAVNADPDIKGIMVLYPLGFRRKDEDIMDLIDPGKDIEGMHSINFGYLIKYKRFLDEGLGLKCVVPATAKALVKTIQHYDIPIEKSFSVIVNNSMRIGKPLGLMLENLGATVVKCYDRTKKEDLENAIAKADILVTAVPDKNFRIPSDIVKKDAVVLDASFEGNLNYDELREKASFITSPENRIGKVTRAMIFTNFSYCSKYG
ncbi:MAG: bifunctional 5,10-methylenetetrahydrofolate dehydrogenase/5,10-methenyltetrahydrofolate cyclohydrolase [Proteobacteria bacterium]|nr:bifunctional 5,10-methylenetetrahydrofolate dehydrogenase/5,10-methenyltetrahydrofolate cyclohydrolase [Pseudomonadota bacterium]MBU2573084.1 bifunctional 5,10-methylenetetrahydrofolate dehydrogenase/5,10-methenyltetrahydrofolate cyclohydrolase [Elusimicrobiota bacterium]